MPPSSELWTDEVRSYPLLIEGDPFEELLASARFEDVAKGRVGTVLVRADETGRIPIVRTTTPYKEPAQPFGAVHERLARQIREIASLPRDLNNALIEVYTSAYTTMGSHSDQAQDLADGSFIAVFSCYERPEIAGGLRKLVVESKEGVGGVIEIPLRHKSAVVFSVDVNRRLRHKIVLDRAPKGADNRWLGLTLRTSKTFVRIREEGACFEDGAPLTLASDDERREFYRLRRRENQETDFTYPRLTYTISESDRMPLGRSVEQEGR